MLKNKDLAKLLSRLDVGCLTFAISSSFDYLTLSGEQFALNNNDNLFRRIIHTARWCLQHRSSHHYDEVFFDCTPDVSKIYSRQFSYSVLESHVLLEVSDLYDYSQRILTGQFESTLFNAISDAIVLTEADCISRPGPRIVFCNDTFLEMTGYERQEVLGRSPRFLQGDRTSKAATSTIRTSLSEWKSFKKTLTNFTKSGSPFEVELHISPVKDDTGWYSHWISVQRDVSGHKQVLDYIHKSNMILKTSKIGCWYFNFEHNYLFWDEQMINIHQSAHTKAPKSIEEWAALVATQFSERFTMNVVRGMSGESNIDFEYAISLEENNERWLRVKAERMKADDDRYQSLAGVCFDITDEKASLRAIENHRKIAEKKAKLALLGEVAAGVGHEINNPLCVVTTSIDLLELDLARGIRTQSHFESLTSRMKEACIRIAKIVDGLRNITSVTREGGELTSINIVACIKETIEMLTKLYALESITLTLELDSPINEYEVHADYSGLQQILINLLSNAKHAVQKLDGERRVIHVVLRSHQSYCQLDVIDAGLGIHTDMRGRLFEPFSTNKPVGEGSGLGLSISKNLIESYGGKISFITGENGTCFSCQFIKGRKHSTHKSEAHVEYCKDHVLVVEDDPAVGASIKALIIAIGSECTLVGNGADALTLLASQNGDNFDVILTDIKMPILDGVHFLQTIKHRKLAPRARKYIMTGDVFSLSEESATHISTLASGILKKPLTRADMAHVLSGLDAIA
ncbi:MULTISPECIES: PAS domain-containing protein [unclassified Alteromonas]|uniref:PAS domain-containing protein n=1 Tax=unclassified Alteromonas TaxID=2614992 RepID=UPI00050948FC|nr:MULTISPECIES: PAS domain-containing protein [unclassified Alteromonas]